MDEIANRPTAVIADDHPLMREVMRMRLDSIGVTVVGEAHDGRQAVELVKLHRPALAIIDVRMPLEDGFAVTRQIVARENCGTAVLLLSAGSEPVLVKRAIEAGASGYLCKSSTHDTFSNAIAALLAGDQYVDPTLAAQLMDPTTERLSPREIEVLTLMADGLPNKSIAFELGVSQETVKAQIASIIGKLKVTSRVGAVAYAVRTGLVA